MPMDLKDPMPAPAEMLIPEARDHQKRRYLWTGLVATLAALVFAALIGGAVVLFSGSPSGSRSQRPAAAAAPATAHTSYVYFRPVLCGAPAYSSGDASGAATAPLSCSPTSVLSASNLGVDPAGATNGADGFVSNHVEADTALAAVPSTSHPKDTSSATVLLPVTPRSNIGLGYPRLVLGPAQMTNASVGSASAHRNQTGQWVVDYTMKSADGAALWDRVAHENFHQILGIDFDGTVVSAPIIQPTQTAFSSFEGRGEVSDNLTHTEAIALARALTAHRH
jgi:hypothetical protein